MANSISNPKQLVRPYGQIFVTTSLVMSQLFSIKHKHIVKHLTQLASKLDKDSGILIQPMGSDGHTDQEDCFLLNQAGFELACRGYTGRQINKWCKAILKAFDRASSNAQTTPSHVFAPYAYTSSLQELKTLARVMNQQGMGFYAGEILRIRDQIAQGYQQQPEVAGGAS